MLKRPEPEEVLKELVYALIDLFERMILLPSGCKRPLGRQTTFPKCCVYFATEGFHNFMVFL